MATPERARGQTSVTPAAPPELRDVEEGLPQTRSGGGAVEGSQASTPASRGGVAPGAEQHPARLSSHLGAPGSARLGLKPPGSQRARAPGETAHRVQPPGERVGQRMVEMDAGGGVGEQQRTTHTGRL